MSSAQAANASTITNDYQLTNANLRDASDWTRQIKERAQYNLYDAGYTGNKDTLPFAMKFGNQFRYTYLFGKLKCTTPETCSGALFSGGPKSVVGGV